MPLFDGLNRADLAQYPLVKVVIVDVDVALQGLCQGQGLGIVGG